MMRVAPFVLRHEGLQIALNVARSLPERQPEAMRDAKDVRIDCESGLLEGDRHDHARGFSSDAGERFELLAF